MQKLGELLKQIDSRWHKIDICSIALDSRCVKSGSLFVAIKGHSVDGRQFITQAIANGATAVLSETTCENEHLQINQQNNVPVISYFNLTQHLSKLAGKFYQQPAQKLDLIGVTGTNGKTTISQLLAQWVQLLGKKPAVMGTIGNGLYGQVKEATNTTGSAIEIQSCLADFIAQGANFAAIEVSSHGLVQHRVEALNFKAVLFTNLSRDHLDYHGNIQAYAQAKKRLFTELLSIHQIINADDQIGAKWLSEMPQAIAVSTNPNYQPTQQKWIKVTKTNFNHYGVNIQFDSSWGTGELESHLIGAFNVSNLMMAMATLLALGYSLADLIRTATKLNGICGRMQMFTANNKPTVIVDYAHTPDALEKALIAAKSHCRGKLYCVFGCGGDRDRGKRPLMAAIAEKLADEVVITDDNPRTENSNQIVADILAGFNQPNSITVIHHREQAIETAIKNAIENDVILIAGKGHEDYQIIGTEKLYFSDQAVVKKYL